MLYEVITGTLIPAAENKTSCINAKPCDEVAVKVLAPAALAPIHALIAECSLSTLMYSASNSPFETKSASFSTHVV